MKLLTKAINKSSNNFQDTGINYLMWWNTVWRNILLKNLEKWELKKIIQRSAGIKHQAINH